MLRFILIIFSVLLIGRPLQAGVFSSAAKGNIFSAEEGSVLFKPEHPADIASGKILVRDEQNHLLAEIPASSGSTEVSIPLPGRGFYALEASLTFRNGKTTTFSTTAAVVGPLLDEAVRRRSRLGLWNVHGDADLAVTAGANWNRQMTSLRKLPESILQKPDPALPHFNSSANAMTNVGVLTAGLPDWIMVPESTASKSHAHPLRKPRDWETLRRLIKAWVESTAAKFPPYLEIYNEPEWQWEGSREDLVHFLTVIAETVKAVRPDVRVLGPGFSTIRIKDPARLDLVTVRKQGLLDHLDGIVLHAYVDGSAPEDDFVSRIEDLQKYLEKIGKGALPIHLTEFGWTSLPGTWQRPVDEWTQARYVARSLTLLTALGVENATYFCMLYRTKKEGEHGFSVLHNDQTPKPSYAAFANVARWLAGVEGKGDWLRLSPTTHLVIFHKENRFIGVAWDTAGERRLALPVAILRATDMMGRPIAVERQLTLSPSPVFLEFAENESFDLDRLALRQIMRGNSLELPDGGSWIALDPLQTEGNTLRIPPQAKEGNYLLLAKDGAKWRGLPIEVIPPLQVEPSMLNWPAESPWADLKVPAQSYASGSLKVRASLQLDKARDRFAENPNVQPGEAITLSIPLDGLQPGQRYRGELAVDAEEGGRRDQVKQPIDLTILGCERVDKKTPNWDRIPVVDFSNWDPFGKPSGPGDCSATLQTAYSATGLFFRIRVSDDAHLQTQNPEQLWTQDGLQIGLDADFEKSWEANDLFGLKGHRIFEYGVAWDGRKPMTWRWISYTPDLPVGTAEPRIQVQTSRENDVTDYRIFLPWDVMGLSAAPKPGTAIGISIALTDADPGKVGRHGLRLFGGITDGKDPQKYGSLWLR